MAKSSGTARKSPARPSAAKKTTSAAKPRAAAKSKPKAAAKASAKPAKKAPAARAAAPAPKPAAKAAVKTTAKAAAKASSKKTPAKATPAPAPAAEPAAPKAGPTLAPAARDDQRGSKTNRKGITIVNPKNAKKGKDKPSAALNHPGPQLLSPGSPIRRPLIPSGPNAPSRDSQFGAAQNQKPKKSPFNKRQLDRYRQILLRKRAELIGDVSQMETEALQANSGSLSNLPQHMAEQGSDTYGQTLALDLAAADRRLIREIDDALKRIEAGTYGVCELSGQPIRAERLEELPWARYSIEAAREIERRGGSAL